MSWPATAVVMEATSCIGSKLWIQCLEVYEGEQLKLKHSVTLRLGMPDERSQPGNRNLGVLEGSCS